MEQWFSFGRHRFDPRTGRLWAGRREVKLTPRSAAVLATLIEHAGQPVTRDELFRSVWRDTVVGDEALTTCIQELRRALEDDARHPRFIETRHRRGYRFVARTEPVWEGPGGDVPPAAPALMVGHDRELAELRACLTRAMGGSRQIVFITGEQGIGKTTVVANFLAAGCGESVRVGHGRCVETHGAGEAYMPLLEAMTRLCREPGGPTVVRLLRHYAPTWLTQMPAVMGMAERRALSRQSAGASRERMLRELAEAAEILAADTPLVLWLEDLHWSDPSTVDWLAYLAGRPGPSRVLVLASYRPGEALARGHPIEAIKDELRVHGQCREMALAQLDETAVSAYLDRRFLGTAAPGLAGLIHRRTGGNPLFVVSVVDDLERRALLVDRSARSEVRWNPDADQIEIPEDVRRLIGHELDRLTARQRRLLEAASAAGVAFSAATVATAEQRSLEGVERDCAELARHACFLASRGTERWPDRTVAGRYEFCHALHQEVVYERIPIGRRAELHRRIAERLEVGLGRPPLEGAAQLAMHFERGLDVGRATRYLLLAGEIATRRSATREAVAHLTRALDLLAAEPETPQRAEREVALQIALGGPLMALKGRGAPEVGRVYTRAQELCRQIDDPARLFPVLWGLFLFRRSRGEIDVACEIGERLLMLAQRAGDPRLSIEAHHALWAALFARGDLAAARDHTARALRLYDPDQHASLAAVYGNHDAAVCALGHGAWALALSGEPEEASRQSEEAVALARRLGHPFSEAHALLSGARVYQLQNDWRTTRDRAEAAAVLARERGFVQLQAWGAMTGGWALARAGEIDTGLSMMREGLATIRALGSEDFRTYFLGLLAEALGEAGRAEASLEVVTEALAAAERSGERFYSAELHRLRGEQLRAAGHDRAGVAGCFRASLAIARQQGAATLERRTLASLGVASDPG